MPESIGLTAKEAERYSRHLILPDFGPEGQRRLKGSSVLVVGLGGLGIPAAVYLASAGVGKIGLVDADVVEMHNLQRQFIFSEADIGKNKIDIAQERLAKTNPNVTIVKHPLKLDSTNALEIMRDYEVILDATDNLPARYLINDACVLLQKPDVYASVLGFDGQASVFLASAGPCYRCLYSEPPPPESVKSCEEAGVLGVIPGIMGGLQANQAIDLLCGKGSPLVGRLLIFNGFDNSFDEVRIRKNPSCKVCGPNPTITALIDYEEFCGTKDAASPEFDMTPAELRATLEGGDKVFLLDVREPYEYEICHIEDSELLPLGELQGRIGELPKNREIVVYCHVGVRSTSAVAILRAAGLQKSRNLKGGIDAWAVEVDPSMTRY